MLRRARGWNDDSRSTGDRALGVLIADLTLDVVGHRLRSPPGFTELTPIFSTDLSLTNHEGLVTVWGIFRR
jgi:hypothetical protein